MDATVDHPGDDTGLVARVRAASRAERLLGLALVVYLVVVTIMRLWGGHTEWASEGDWRQWVFTYWKSYDPSLLPGDNLLTDYLEAMQPPLYRLLMSSIGHFLVPTKTAFVVGIIAWLALMAGMLWGIRRRFGWLLALLATALLVRDVELFNWSTGGYPRSFGPALTCWFIMALWHEQHRLMLVLLVVGAALYPSVVVPAGLACGTVVVGSAVVGVVDLRVWWRRVVELGVTGVLVCAFALSQNLVAEPWWGKVQSAADAGIALSPTGRWHWTPLEPFWSSLPPWLAEPFSSSGWVTLRGMLPFVWPEQVLDPILQGIVVVVVVAAFVVLVRRAPRTIPWRLFIYFGAVLVAYAAARALAFKLYLPRRMIQHTLPILTVVFVVVVVALAAEALWRRRQVAAVFLLVVLPTVVLTGDGIIGSRVWRDKSDYAALVQWARTSTAKDAQFGGDLYTMDWVPLYVPRHVYANFTLAHPIRPGFYAEVERRILDTYDAMYATDLRAVLAFMDRADIDYLLVDTSIYARVEAGWGHLFEPIRTMVQERYFAPRKAVGFALLKAPASSI
ncbi:MAG TPA: hypothetical protein VGF99_00100, partial [Myxococcota bacterium]